MSISSIYHIVHFDVSKPGSEKLYIKFLEWADIRADGPIYISGMMGDSKIPVLVKDEKDLFFIELTFQTIIPRPAYSARLSNRVKRPNSQLWKTVKFHIKKLKSERFIANNTKYEVIHKALVDIS